MSESTAFFINGGAVIHRLSANAENINDDVRTQIASTTESNIGAKVGAGLQWDFSNNWAVSLSYNHFTFMSIDNTSLMFEYRF
jgi:outer membrane immunogenic protein